MAAKDNISNQFIDVYHRSRSHVPPHEVSGREYFYENFEDRPEADIAHFENVNPYGDYIFTGTREAANSIEDHEPRPYLHRYRIPAKMVRPETFVDDMASGGHDIPRKTGDNTPYELWEELPVQTHLVTPNDVVRFRNIYEDYGSLSHIIHKQSVKSGKIKYIGMEED